MTRLLQIPIAEPELEKIRALARSGQKPSVEWSPSKADMDAQAFKRRGEILEEIERRIAKLLEPESEVPGG